MLRNYFQRLQLSYQIQSIITKSSRCHIYRIYIYIYIYIFTDISLEYEIVTQPDLTRSIKSEYQHMALLYDRILRHRKIIVNKSDTVWNWAFNMPCKSLKGILVLFEEEKSYT